MIPPEELQRDKDLCENGCLSPKAWGIRWDRHQKHYEIYDIKGKRVAILSWEADARFIIEARHLLPKYIAEVERLTSLLEQTREERDNEQAFRQRYYQDRHDLQAKLTAIQEAAKKMEQCKSYVVVGHGGELVHIPRELLDEFLNTINPPTNNQKARRGSNERLQLR